MEGNNNPQQMHLNYGSGAGQPAQQSHQYAQNTPSANTGPKPVSELLSQNDYLREIQANTACVIDVFTEWCGPCQAIKPFFAGLPNQYPQIRFFKMDLDKNKFLGTNLGIQSIPTFLFIHKGQVVKKMPGADKNGLVNNIKWLVSTYNLTSGPGVSMGAQPKQPEVQKTVQVYSDKLTPFYFDAERWDLPIKNLKEYGTKQSLFTQDPYKEVDKSLVLNFPSVDPSGQNAVISFALSALPLEDADNLVPFIDFFRICLIRPELSK